MARRSRLPARSYRSGDLFILILIISSSAQYATADVRPLVLEPSAEITPKRCSERYEPREEIQLYPAETARKSVENAFNPIREWGLEDNTVLISKLPLQGYAVEVHYAAGSRSPSADAPLGGVGFYARGGLGNGTSAACLRYLVKFSSDFDFVEGGKLPGLYGSDGKIAPAGGRLPKRDDGFSLRVMWRTDGTGELYGYFPNMVPSPTGTGMRLGQADWTFPRGRWITIEMEVVLNRPGHSDGVARLWIGGKRRVDVRNIRYRNSARIDIAGIMFSTFFGGDTARFAPKAEQHAAFASFRTFAPNDDH